MPPGVFRSDVQGMRAVAVLIVAIAHAELGFLEGGFVGVDVFFVISGFLITGLLLREAERDGTISLRGFYARRARRILPAATVVLLATVAAAIWLLPAIDAQDAIDDAAWATLFAANLKFARDGTDYFQAGSSTSPLQHYWSLAVEEQFYLAWPLLVLLFCVLYHRHRRGRSILSLCVVYLFVLSLASLLFSVVHTQNDPVPAYFSTLTRAWELGVGALCATWTMRSRTVRPGVMAAVSWLGLGAVVVAALTFTARTPFPGYAAALPVLGAGMLLVGGVGAAPWGPQRLLSVPPLRTVGDWSYSFYLWHWPALVIAGAAFGWGRGLRGLLVLGLALALAALTYRFVENPVRGLRRRRTSHTPGLLLYPATALLVLPGLVLGSTVVRSSLGFTGGPITVSEYAAASAGPAGFSADPAVALVEASVLAAREGAPIPRDLSPDPLELDKEKPDIGGCVYSAPATFDEVCPMGDTDAERTLVVLGDSHARQWVPAIEELAKEQGYRAYYLVRSGCPGADVTPWRSDGSDTANVECTQFQDAAAAHVADLQPDVTILGSAVNDAGWADDDGNHVTSRAATIEMFREGVAASLARLAPHSGRVVFVGDPPQTKGAGPICLSRRGATLEDCLGVPRRSKQIYIEAAREAVAASGADWVDTRDLFCAQGVCPAVVGDFVTRRDEAHVTVAYARHLTPQLDRRLGLG